MKFVISTFAFFTVYLASIPYSAGQRNNYQWLMGYGIHANIPLKFGMSVLNFNDHKISYDLYDIQKDSLYFASSTTYISDKEGKLVLISDFCNIYDKNIEVIEGGADLHTDDYALERCHDIRKDFGVVTCNILIPSLTNDSVYYQIYKDFQDNDSLQYLISRHYYINEIRLLDSGRFKVTRHDTMRESILHLGWVTAIRHRDNQKWWTFSVDYNTNLYSFFLVGGDSLFTGPFYQNIGRVIDKNPAIGENVFSPDGKGMAHTLVGVGCIVYDFDNETGKLSNPKEYKIKIHDPDRANIGIIFAPNSRFIYVSTTGDDVTPYNLLYQIDRQDSSVTLLAQIFDRDETGWPIGIGNMRLGPDCRIYLSTGTTTHYLHVIQEPNKKGIACRFEPSAIDLPVRTTAYLPNFINPRPGGSCDSTYEWPFINTTGPVKEKEQVTLYPNPCSLSRIFLSMPDGGTASNRVIIMTDITGRTVLYRNKLQAIHTEIDVSSLGTGLYFYRITDTAGNILQTGKWVKGG